MHVLVSDGFQNMSVPKFSRHLIQAVQNLPKKFSERSINGKFSSWMTKYEDFVGLTEVKAAQSRVLESERRFVKSQEDRRDIQRQITAVQQKLHELHIELDRIPRGDDKYLALITHEHSVIKEEKRLKEEFQQFEKDERENFAILSHAVRDSHEKERAQAEKTKYWSIIGSVLGTMLGVIGTTVNNRLRMKELRDLVESTARSNNELTNVEEFSKGVTAAIQKNLNNSTNSFPVQNLPDPGWKQLQDSIVKLTNECDSHQLLISNLSKELQKSLNEKGTSLNNIDVQNNYTYVINSLRGLLEDQTQHSNRLAALTCILVPTCTWALVKFLNL